MTITLPTISYYFSLSSLTIISKSVVFVFQIWQEACTVRCHHRAEHLQQCFGLRSVLARLHHALLFAGPGSDHQLHSCICSGYGFFNLFCDCWLLSSYPLVACSSVVVLLTLPKLIRTHLKFFEKSWKSSSVCFGFVYIQSQCFKPRKWIFTTNMKTPVLFCIVEREVFINADEWLSSC